jgi:uncharacterized protein (TIGR02466 family)
MGTTQQIFSTPVYEGILPKFDSVKDRIIDLVKVCLDEGIKRQSNSFTKPDDSRMSITKDIYLQNDPRFKFLIDILDEVNYQYWLDCDYDPAIKPKITHMWGIINRPEGFTPPHTHSPAIVTGCLYLNATSETGDFQLDHPMKDVLGYMPFDRKKYPPPFHFSKTFKVEPGKIVLFPGWAIHYAKMNNTNFDRYALAFNVGELVVKP